MPQVFDSYAEIFATRASAYHSAMQMVPDARAGEFRAMVEPIPAGSASVVCDMPAGGCYLAPYLPEGMRYVGVEPAAEFLDLCAGGVGDTLHAPITDVPLADGSADHVVSLAGLHHEQTLAPVFAEMRRLVRPGGRVVIADVAADTAPARFLNGFVARHNPLGHEGRFLDGKTAGSLERAGLRVLDDRLIDVPWVFDSRRQAASFCTALFGIAGLSDDAVEEALDRELGIEARGAGIGMNWVLRRIVCEPS